MFEQQAKQKAEIEIGGPRVALRPLRDADIAAVQPWYGEAALDEPEGVQNLRHRLEAVRADPEAGLLAIVRRNDPSTEFILSAGEGLRTGPSGRSGRAPAPIGVMHYRASDPAPGWLSIGFIAVAPAHRGFGYGAEAVRLLEAASHVHGASRFRAGVPAGNGLGFYFWLRLGYRPARSDERLWPSGSGRDMIFLIHLLDS